MVFALCACGQPAAPAEAMHEEPHEQAPAFVPLHAIMDKVHEIIELESEEDGYMLLSQVGVMLSRLYADFDSRNYGYSKLHKLIDSTGAFETKLLDMPGGGKNVMVRNK